MTIGTALFLVAITNAVQAALWLLFILRCLPSLRALQHEEDLRQ